MPSKILYAVLNWGLGHASRSIPIINKLIELKNEIIIASDGEALVLLKKEFPNLVFEELEPYNVQYSKNAKDFDKAIFFQLSKLGKAIKKEHSQTFELIKKHSITHIISDNRYGVHDSKIPSAIICHQIDLQHKNSFVKKQINKIHFSLLNKFNTVWIPDFEGENSISGNISSLKYINKTLKTKLKYIGIVSRMKKLEVLEKKYSICVVLSGPEPQRTILENLLLKELGFYDKKIAFIRGTNLKENKIVKRKNLDIFLLLNSKEINTVLNNSELIICRAGYSSIMDLISIKKQAILIPTPGQTEQEYLANILSNKKIFLSINQESFKMKTALKKGKNYSVKNINISKENLIKNTLNSFLSLQ